MVLCFLPGPFFHFSTIGLHAAFIGQKKKKSSGWHKCVLLGGKKTNAMSYFSHAAMTSSDRCELRLSPIRTFRPVSFLMYGIIILLNQSLKQVRSNQPDLLRLYRAPAGPTNVHVS